MTKLNLVKKTILCSLALIICNGIYAQVNNDGIQCFPEFNPCQNVNILDFTENGINWGEDDMAGSYTVGEQTFDININDQDGIFAPFQPMVDADDIGSFENNTGIAVGINPRNTDDVIEINYNLSLVSDYVAFTIRDIDSKYKYASKQIEKVCVFGYLDGVEILPVITPFCGGSVEVNGNCAVGKADSADGKDESIRIVFETCIDEIKIIYGNASNAANDPTYSRIFIGDDTGFGTAVCTDECDPCTAEAAEISLDGSENTICVDDGVDEPINVQVTGGNGETSAWVITDEDLNIVGLPDGPPFVLDGAGVGVCTIWYLNWDGELASTPMMGINAADLVGNSECAELSNPIAITRQNCCTAEAAEISLDGSENAICVDDSVDEPINVQVTGGNGETSAWVITDENANIVGLPDGPPFILDGAGVGTCTIWYLNWDGDLASTPMMGINAAELVSNSECAVLSNPIDITRENCCTAEQGAISFEDGSTMLDVCVNDEDLIDAPVTFSLVEPGSGETSAWVITDENAIIREVLDAAPSLSLYDTGVGTMQIWYLTWDGDLSSAPVAGANAANIVANSDCAALSEPVTIVKDCCCPYTIEFLLDDLECRNGLLLPRTMIVEDTSLSLDDGTSICDERVVSCSEDPAISDSNGEAVRGAITVGGDYSASVTCVCTPDVSLTIPQDIISDCTDSRIDPPVLEISDITGTSANLSFTYDGPGSILVEIKEESALTYDSFPADLGVAALTGLTCGTTYNYRSVVVDENNNRIATGNNQTFTTAACRNINIGNINMRSMNVKSTSAILTWDNIPGCLYTVYYRIEGDNQWRSYDTNIPYVVMFGLNPCTNYQWALKISDDETVSDMSSAHIITTPCDSPRLANPSADNVKIGDLSDLQNIELELFVNPATATLTVNYMGLPVNGINIYGVNGQLAKNVNISNATINTIDVSNLSAGVYILVSNFDNGIAKNKFAINK